MNIYFNVPTLSKHGKALNVAYPANENMFAVGVCGCFGFCFMGNGKSQHLKMSKQGKHSRY